MELTDVGDLVDKLWDKRASWISDLKHEPEGWMRGATKDLASELVRIAWYTSFHTEEGVPVRLQILWADPKRRRQGTVPLVAALPYTIETLTKIFPLAGHGTRQVVVASKDGKLKIVGAREPTLGTTSPPSWLPEAHEDFDRVLVTIVRPGHVRIGFPAHIELDRGELRSTHELSKLAPVKAYFQSAAPAILAGATEGKALPPERLLQYFWTHVLRRSAEIGRGGTFVLLPEWPSADAFIKGGQGFEEGWLLDALKNRYAAEEAAVQLRSRDWTSKVPDEDRDECLRVQVAKRPYTERDLVMAADVLASAASCDGATLISTDLNEVTYGVKLTAQSKGSDVASGYGTRHGSAAAFVMSVEGAIAIVISQDGRMTLFWMEEGNARKATIALNDDWRDY